MRVVKGASAWSCIALAVMVGLGASGCDDGGAAGPSSDAVVMDATPDAAADAVADAATDAEVDEATDTEREVDDTAVTDTITHPDVTPTDTTSDEGGDGDAMEPDAAGCEGPNPQGCESTGCGKGEICDLSVGCFPSSCLCDAETGVWICTEDCGGGACVPDGPAACDGPNPVGCAVAGCDAGFVCSFDAGCAPSQCSCDADTGSWLCTKDCGGGVCVPETPGACAEPNPVGCAELGCKKGQVCSFDAGCAPSQCSCDATTGSWLCTKDCGGGVCVPETPGACTEPNPVGCLETGCPKGLECSTEAGCAPSMCQCDEASGAWACTKDCGGGVCVEQSGGLCDPADNPAGCLETGCGKGEVCDPTAGCAPSACGCDPETGLWMCTADCSGGTCVPGADMCDPSADPSGCVNKGCDDGFVCDTEVGCRPSLCGCDSETGEWWCTDDCGGGTCVAK